MDNVIKMSHTITLIQANLSKVIFQRASSSNPIFDPTGRIKQSDGFVKSETPGADAAYRAQAVGMV